MRRVYSRIVAEMPLRHHEWRHDAGAVARVDAGLLDVLHDAADDDRARRIGHRIDVELEGVLEKAIDQHRPVVRDIDRAGHVAIERSRVEDDGHAASAQHVRRPYDDRIPDPLGDFARFLARHGRAACRLRHAEIPEQLRKALAILRKVDRVG